MKTLLVTFILTLLGKLPLRLRAIIGRCAGRLFYLAPTRDRRIARLQMDLFIPELGGGQRLAGVYASLGQTLLESLNLLPLLSRSSKYISCPDLDLVARIHSEKRPVLALTGHLANWDLLAAWTISQGFDLVTVGREAQSAAFQAALTRIRTGYGIQTIWRGDPKGLRKLVGHFRRGGVVAALLDQDTSVVSQLIPFFGYAARTPSSLVELALKFNATIVTVFGTRDSFQHYTIRVQEIEAPEETGQILSIFNQRLEAFIRAYPEQWVWMHKRWRSLDSGERLSSQDYLKYLEKRLGLRTLQGARQSQENSCI